jgi:Uma2 family endonuclease
MASSKPRVLIEIAYAAAAQDYLRSLPPEHFMEATSQATQRKITLESLDLVHAARPEIQVFNELLVQYPRPGERRPGQVVPDNMVVVCEQPIDADGSFDVPLQPVGPFWVLEYVSKHNKRKDYDDNFEKYEKELKVPYFLLFYPETRDLTLYHHTGRKYKSVPANGHGRHPIPDLEVEVELRDEWVRFWFRGELLPLPADLQRQRNEARRQTEELQQALEKEREARRALERELEQLRAQQPRPKNGKRPPKGA